LNNKLLRALIADASAWEEVSYHEDPAVSPISYAHPAQAI
jgi:UDP-3-O-[3-hydroxymyristoyl] N-acetylglucosamine deacetylase